ncbi:hypothetical protein MCOR27_007312 [Pyricularia oryzae]|nr:hypothetical protein MCOR01_000727 [Pyricularia oryzae]KAI6274676.1 hypothetical protein MCOR27_007312 [Pyricularia oryzae]KAI6279443.1 hypothetical protein MCOR26_004171 [Pyricularia oryzae]KAI6310486.1 hypothetical protein MCOR34_006389 [Pyricularia oryzae]KAI6312425.1 hypothetical protein MCOR29_008023 [Pyricularia oryzae]
MSNRHLPAGQAMEGAGSAGVAMSPSHGGPGPSPGPRRGGRPPAYHQSHSAYSATHHQQFQPHVQHPGVYSGYMGHPYANYGYPHTAPMPPPYQNGAQYYVPNMPGQPYMPYPAQYARSPPSMHQYVHTMGTGAIPPQPVPQPQAYQRNQQSPIVVSSPYPNPPPPPRSASHNHAMVVPPQPIHSTPQQAAGQYVPQSVPQTAPRAQSDAAAHTAAPVAPVESEAPPTPSSSSSAQAQAPALPMTPPTPQTVETSVELSASPKAQAQVNLSPPQTTFTPPLPWSTHPDESWPKRANKIKRCHKALDNQVQALSLPAMEESGPGATADRSVGATEGSAAPISKPAEATAAHGAGTSAAGENDPFHAKWEAPVQADPVTHSPSSQDQPSGASTSPTTPASINATPSATSATPTPGKTKGTSRPAAPAVPIIPAVPKGSPKEARLSQTDKVSVEQKVDSAASDAGNTASTSTLSAGPSATESPSSGPPPASAPAAPKLWTGLFSKAAAAAVSATPGESTPGQTGTNGTAATNSAAGNTATGTSGFVQSKNNSLAEALRAYRVGNGDKLAFIEPRGLINTGNMCYMNSVLQVLLFCTPFYDFLEQAGKKVTHSFNSETPLIDAMIEFMRDFKIIDSAISVDQLRRRLKSEELEQYGEPFTPEFIYEAIRKLPRFSSMRRGHQQDAEEFLGFFLESLHDECSHVMRAAGQQSITSTAPQSSAQTPTTSAPSVDNDWLEVGPRQRAAITRSSGHSDMSSPVTKIFGGELRSELRVPGLKDSVTLEPYQPLQLDIGAPQVRNIVDALRHLTNPESLRGDFNSPRGKDVSATKQVFIESLPPVLILHLKRFQFDAEGNGTVKIWKKVGYPLELEIPREVLSRAKRTAGSLPKYKLIAAVYHHGKNASGGHYTADVRRQDGTEWIRLDDTVIRRVRSEDVAEGGAEEDVVKGDNASRKDGGGYASAAANRFAGMGEEDVTDDDGWKQVSTPASGGKKWSSLVNGASPTAANKGKQIKDNIKDNKVAYLLFYQRI